MRNTSRLSGIRQSGSPLASRRRSHKPQHLSAPPMMLLQMLRQPPGGSPGAPSNAPAGTQRTVPQTRRHPCSVTKSRVFRWATFLPLVVCPKMMLSGLLALSCWLQ